MECNLPGVCKPLWGEKFKGGVDIHIHPQPHATGREKYENLMEKRQGNELYAKNIKYGITLVNIICKKSLRGIKLLSEIHEL